MFNEIINAKSASAISSKNKWKIDVEKDIIFSSVISSIKRAANKGQFNTSIKLTDGVLKHITYVYNELLKLNYKVRLGKDYMYINW